MALDINKIRSEFPALNQEVHGRPLVYFDNAASTLKSRPVIDALNQHYSMDTANIHRGIHYLSEKGTVQFEETRKKIQTFLKAKNDYEIVFTKGTTESLNLVAKCYAETFLKEGDEIILSIMEHHSNIVPWQMAAEKVGATIKVVPMNDHGELLVEEYKKLLSPKTKLVSINLVSNSLGTVNPIKELIQEAHKVGAIFVVDAAQGASHIQIDVQDLDCDFLAMSSHKMFGPTGVGVLYGKEELLNKMPPYQGGGDMIDKVTFEKTTYNELPHKFEAGTPHIAGVIAFKAALEYIEGLGFENIQNYEHELLEYATPLMKEIEGLRILGEAKNKGPVISFIMEGGHPHDIGQILDQQGIAIRTGHHCTQPLWERLGVLGSCRASFAIYNTKEEIDLLIKGLKKAKEFF